MQTFSSHFEELHNPLDLVEDIILNQDWAFERRGNEEMAVEIPSRWCDLGVFFAWSPQMNVLHISCATDIRFNDPATRSRVYELIAKANERLWIGHFALWGDESMPIFKYSMLFDGTVKNADELIYELLETAKSECERFYPAFQYVATGVKSPIEALHASLLDTIGEA